ncbi:DMT family transporter [Arhodomonas aquaeolei]|uniref:DMT family transporter n=1 Tax=Arhodomonas aquaeolei TaxID=2369 RepID=UPI002167AB55|nr:DMT family transporter [Arhodomonas aquaeolei]MCS4505830.1 DMT family transporter [Arhodomonas aquaeolei]
MLGQSSNGILRNRYGLVITSALVVVLWGLLPILRAMAASVPALQLTGMAMACAALTGRLLPGAGGSFRGAVREHPWYAWIAVVGGFIGALAFYFVALAHAPPHEVVVVTYTWPLVFGVVAELCAGRRPSVVTALALCLALAGVAVLREGAGDGGNTVWFGYGAGLLSGLCWVGYSLFLQRYSRPVTPAYPAFFAAAAVVALTLQAVAGGLVWPLPPEALLAGALLGVGPYGLAFVGWGHVVRHGSPRLVPMVPYLVPVVAAAVMMLAGSLEPTPRLAAGTALVTAACAMALFAVRRRPGAA